MGCGKVLLFDLDGQNGSGEKLHSILTQNTSPLKLIHERFSPADASSPVRQFASSISRIDPDLTVLLFISQFRSALCDLLQPFRCGATISPLIAVVDSGEPAEIREMLRNGASDFLVPPFRATDVLPLIGDYLTDFHRQERPIQQIKDRIGLSEFIGESPVLIKALKNVSLIAESQATVLIAGETGTGKEICARAIHELSGRSKAPFMSINCGALPPELIENELYGHEAGAFTSANTAAIGMLRSLDGGTVCLDEIDTLPLMAQAKLLRFLEQKEFKPLGSQKIQRTDVRVLASSNVKLAEAVRLGRFRQDLFYRLNVVTIELPPLRDRQDDIPLLSAHFLQKFASRHRRPTIDLTAGAVNKLLLYKWPGNVRELQNVIERSIVMSNKRRLEANDILLQESGTGEHSQNSGETFKQFKKRAVDEFERTYLKQALSNNSGNITQAARWAGKHRRAFVALMRKHGFESASSQSNF